jgi:hypothetical protein
MSLFGFSYLLLYYVSTHTEISHLFVFLRELNPKSFRELFLILLPRDKIPKFAASARHCFLCSFIGICKLLTRKNEYIHSAEVVPWQMFLATYVGMIILKKILSDTVYLSSTNYTSTMPTLKRIRQDASVSAMMPAVMPAQPPAPALAPSSAPAPALVSSSAPAPAPATSSAQSLVALSSAPVPVPDPSSAPMPAHLPATGCKPCLSASASASMSTTAKETSKRQRYNASVIDTTGKLYIIVCCHVVARCHSVPPIRSCCSLAIHTVDIVEHQWVRSE